MRRNVSALVPRMTRPGGFFFQLFYCFFTIMNLYMFWFDLIDGVFIIRTSEMLREIGIVFLLCFEI